MERYKKYEGERYWNFGREGGELEMKDGSVFSCANGAAVIVTESGDLLEDGHYLGQVIPGDLEALTGSFEEN